MEENKSNNYDDFDMVKLEGEISTDGLFSPFTFIFFFVFIVLSGLLLLYSSTFDLAVKNGFEHYHYLLKQAIGLGGGILLGIILNFIPLKALKNSYILLFPISIAVLVLMLFPDFNDNGTFVLFGYHIVSGAILGAFAVIALLAGTISFLYKLKERKGFFFVPLMVIVMAIAILSGIVDGMGYYFLIAFVSISMLYASGARKSFVVLFGLFMIITGLFIVFVSLSYSSSFFSSIFPVAVPEVYEHGLFSSQLAIKEGGLCGVGLGKGLYKLGVLSDVGGRFIFSSISEEIGLVGILVFFFVFLCYFFLGVMAARRAYKKGEYKIAGASIGLSAIVIIEALLSGLYCCGLFPFGPLLLPFFSYGVGNEMLFVSSAFVLYRYIYLMGRSNEKG